MCINALHEAKSLCRQNAFSASQEIPGNFLETLSSVPFLQEPLTGLSQISKIHDLLFYFLRIYFNIILPYMHRSSKWSLSFRYSNQKPTCINFSPTCVACLANLIHLHDYPNDIWEEEWMNFLIMQFSLANCHFLPVTSRQSPKHLVFIHFKSYYTK